MASLNKALLIGRITADPELRYTPQGVAVCDLRMAINRNFNDAQGNKREETCFVDVTAWRRTAEVSAQYLKKGSPVFIEGHLVLDTWETPDKQKRSRLRVVADNVQFLERGARPEGQPGGPAAAAEAPPPPMEPPPETW
ncbi:MAG: single-stranded DNA-binding protein [Planctomycetes bacterium]|nr:single-stranded DNA-binding protein [Planctomycetota bacterium]